MDKAARRRWAVLLGALTATIAAIVYPVEQPGEEDAVVDIERSRSSVAAANTAERDFAEPLLDEPESVDPFAPRGWQAPPAPPPVAVIAAPVMPEAPVAPAGPPPLPYKFMGRLHDGGAEVVYLSRGDQTLVVRDGETLESTYKVVAMNSQQIEFEHLPTGEKQTLLIPAPEK